MDIRFYNSLTHQMETFQPVQPGRVAMYNCGPTVYDYAHIGNFRSFVFADVLRRFLELSGYEVDQVMNITDVGHMTEDQLADGGGEDKMQLAARRLKENKKSGKVDASLVKNPDDPYQVAAYYTRAFIEDAKALGLKIADEYNDDPTKSRMPKATEHVEDMKILVASLLEKGHAYIAKDGAVYFDVQSFPEYGKLSGNTLDQLRCGAGGRVEAGNQASKKHPADFLLWKPDESHIMKWESPWGKGYPGWHIECSAMARALLKQDVIDIHTGGEDNIFPHHECEIAQTRGVTGKSHFAKYWLHTRFLLVEGEKMSKSKGNFFTLRDVMEGKATDGYKVPAQVIRYELLKGHYRSNMNFTAKGLQDSAYAVDRLSNAYWNTWLDSNPQMHAQANADIHEGCIPVVQEFISHLNDDLNIAGALGCLFAWFKGTVRKSVKADLALLTAANQILGVMPNLPHDMPEDDRKNIAAQPYRIFHGTLGKDKLNEITKEMKKARDIKDYETSDKIRQELIDKGYQILIGSDFIECVYPPRVSTYFDKEKS